MSELNVTPGEWVAEIEKGGFQQYSFVVIKQGGHDYFVATIESGVPGNTIETEANNAHLIAASKELYEALARMVKLFAYCDCHHADCTECKKFEFANAALAKARGEA